MSLLIPGIEIHKVPEANLETIGLAFDRYEILMPTGSVEGLESMAGNIGIGLADFITKTGMNVKTALVDFDKDVKRSVLQVLMDSNKLGMNRIMTGNYSYLSNAVCIAYPFSQSPVVVSTFLKNTFERIHMTSRIVSLIENYRHLAAAVNARDASLVTRLISNISSLNIGKQLNIKAHLLKMIVTSTTTNKTTFGTVFDSMGEFQEVVKLTMSYSNEFNESVGVAKKLELLYGAFDDLKVGIQAVSNSTFDFSKLRGVGQIIHDTSSLIEDYAMMVKEYHHLEMFLTNLSGNLLTAAKK